MSRTIIGEALDAANTFATMTRGAVAQDPQLLQGTPEALIECVLEETLIDLHEEPESTRIAELFKDLMEKHIFRELIHSLASSPQFNLHDIGRNMLFAEAWASYGFARMVMRHPVNLNEAITPIAMTCCQQLESWAKAGYRMDWHSLDTKTQNIDPSAPVGVWNKEMSRPA